MKKIVTAGLLLSFMNVSVYAGWTTTKGTVTNVTSHNGVHLVKTTITDVTCGGTGNFWWPTTDPDAKDMLSISLAALMSDKRVSLVHSSDTPDCMYTIYNKASHISIEK